MLKPFFAGLCLALASMAAHADNCEPIRAQIEAKYKSGGIVNFSLTTVDAGATGAGKVVGSCGNGTKRIVFIPGGQQPAGASAASAPAAVPARPARKPVLTECKDGTVSSTGSCRK